MAEDASTDEETAGPGGGEAGREYVEENLGLLLMRAFYDFRGLLQRQLKAHELDEWMRPGMGPVIFALLRKDNVTIREIGATIQLAPSTLTNTLKSMEKTGLVNLAPCDDDRRAVRVSLTDLGRSLGPKLSAMHDENRKYLTEGMTEEEVAGLKRGLAKVIDALELNAWKARRPDTKDEG